MDIKNIDKDAIYTEPEAAECVRTKETTLRNARRRGKVIGFRQGNDWFYRGFRLIEYVEFLEGEICEVNQNLSNSQIGPGISNPPSGTSAITKDEVSARLRGISLARKTMKHLSRSPRSSSKEKNPQQENRIN